MMKKSIITVSVITTIALLSGCGSDSNSNNSPDTNITPPADNNIPPNNQNPIIEDPTTEDPITKNPNTLYVEQLEVNDGNIVQFANKNSTGEESYSEFVNEAIYIGTPNLDNLLENWQTFAPIGQYCTDLTFDSKVGITWSLPQIDLLESYVREIKNNNDISANFDEKLLSFNNDYTKMMVFDTNTYTKTEWKPGDTGNIVCSRPLNRFTSFTKNNNSILRDSSNSLDFINGRMDSSNWSNPDHQLATHIDTAIEPMPIIKAGSSRGNLWTLNAICQNITYGSYQNWDLPTSGTLKNHLDDVIADANVISTELLELQPVQFLTYSDDWTKLQVLELANNITTVVSDDAYAEGNGTLATDLYLPCTRAYTPN